MIGRQCGIVHNLDPSCLTFPKLSFLICMMRILIILTLQRDIRLYQDEVC